MASFEKTQFVRDLKEKEPVASPFLVKYAQVGTDKNGKAFLNLILMDRTGEIEGRCWEGVPVLASQAVRDAFVWVEGRCQVFQGRRQIVVNRVQALREDEVTVPDYLQESRVQVEPLYQQLLGFVSSMQDPDYKALAESVLKEDAEIVDLLKKAPAAKSVHHAYRGGLLEHLVSVTGLLDRVAQHYGPILNRDLLFIGGFFHDICKIWELSYDRVTEYTTEGRLIGHLVMAVELIERKAPSHFPLDKKLLAKHVVLAHHGELEFGSPKRPKCLEAHIVHAIDDLDSKINAIHTFIEADTTSGPWTGLNRMYERYFFKTTFKDSTTQA